LPLVVEAVDTLVEAMELILQLVEVKDQMVTLDFGDGVALVDKMIMLVQ
jgi:hypothetical protein